MKQIFSRILLLVVVIAAILGLSSCKIFVEQEPSTYDLVVNKFERSVVYGSELNLSGLDIEVTTNGEVKHVEVTKDMVTGGTTTEVGEQELVIEYQGMSWTLYYEVFYKIDHIVDGFIYDSQLVTEREEYMPVKNPEKEGSIFLGWSAQIPETLTGNLRIEALFADGLTLPDFSATYGDTLGDLTLPETKDGHWEWKQGPETSVGNAGTNKFAVVFVPNNPAAKAFEVLVDVTVAKKKLTFTIINDVYDWDGSLHRVEYQLSDGVDPNDVKIICFGTEYATEPGEYSYDIQIRDTNYEGQIKGIFKINKVKLTVDVLLQDGDTYSDNATITYGDSFPGHKVVIKDKNGNDYVLDRALEVSINKPSMLIAGYYDIVATIKDITDDGNNDLRYYDITYNIAKLVVKGVDFDPGPPLLKENYDIYYGDLLSSIEFADHPNGVWVWDYTYNEFAAQDFVGNAGKNTFRAEFIPKDSSYNKSEAYIVLDVNKRVLRIDVDPASTSVVYDGQEHGLSYVIVDPTTGRVFDNLIVNGDVKYVAAYGNGYNITLSIDDANYTGSVSTALKIAKADPVTDFSKVITLTWRTNLKLSDIALDEGYEWKYKNTTIDVAGEYIFDAIFTPEDTDNYNIINGQITVIVEKAQSSITGVAEKYDTWTYNGSDFEFNREAFGYESVGGAVVYLYNGEPVTSLNNAGEYLITLVIAENDTHLGCEVSTIVVIKKANPQISMLNINGWTYGDDANAPSAKTTFGDIVYRYYTKEAEQYVLYGADGLTAPTEAGTYYVHASVAATDNWNGAESIYKEFKIEKQTVALPSIDDIVYEGKLVKPSVAESVYYTVAEGGNEGGENVGEYGVTLVLVDSGNYKWDGLSSATATVKYKITKFNDNVISDFDGGEWTYEDTVSHSTKSIFGEVRYTYYLKKANGDYERVTEAKNAGEYKVEARVAETNNYNGCSLEKTFVIEKKSVDVPSLSQDQISFVYTSKTITSGFSAPAGAYYKVSDIGGRDVGDYYVTLTLNAPSNYKWDDGEDGSERKLKYSITKDEVTITTLTIVGWKYKGTINAPTAEIDKTYTEPVITYQYKTLEGDWIDTTITANSVAGTYRVVATVADTVNYDGDVETFEFAIIKADNATINGIIWGGKYTNVYNKNASYVISGLSGSHTETELTYTITKDGESVDEMKSAGTYTVVITLPESDNYESVSETVTVEITKKEISKPTLSSVSAYYNGGEFVPVPSTSDDYEHEFENASSTAAGTYKVTFALTDENYVWDPDIVWESGIPGVLTYTIQKGSIGIEGNVSNRNNVPYTLLGYTLTDIVASGVNVNLTLTPSITLDGEEVNEITNVGTYTVIYRYVDTTGNYNDREVKFTVTITKAENRFTTNPAGNKSWTYGNAVDTSVFGAKATFGEVKYRFFTDSEGQNPIEVTSETRLAYGTYYVQAYMDDDSDNYQDCVSTIVAFNITKATATISGMISSESSVYGQYAEATKDELVANASVTLAYGSAVKPTVTIMYTPVSGGEAISADTIYNAGTYVVTYSYVDGNHDLVTETATIIIDRADTAIEVVESDSKDYDNVKYVLPVTVKVNGVDITLGENGLTYVITKNGTPVDEIKNAGTYIITYTYVGDANYKAGVDATTVVVNKVTPSITHWTDHTLVYDTYSVTYKATATASGVAIADNYVSVAYYTKSGDNKYTPINAPASKGTYYYMVTVAEGENWNAHNTGYVEFTVAQGQANITDFVVAPHGYNGSVAPIPTAHTNLGTVYYYFKSATKSGSEFVRWTAANGPKDADTYIVYAEVINDVNGNYLGDKTAEINYVITPASTIITAGNVGKTYGFSYTTLESLIGATYKNVGNVDATAGLKYEITGGDTDKLKDGKIVNVGSYKVTVTLTDTNYTATPVEVTVTVSPKSATITEANNTDTTYKGSAFTNEDIKSLINASIDGIVGNDSTELTYTVSGGKTIENQGTYEVIVSYTSDNYTVISVPVTVTVKPATTSIIANNVNKTYGLFTYNDLKDLIGATYKNTSGTAVTASLSYEITGGDVDKLVDGKIVNAGTYTVTVSLTDTNYTAAPTEVTVYVAPKPFSETVKVYATYDDKLSGVELPDVEGGYLEWHNESNKVGNVGNNIWLARFVADNSGNYANVENVSITVVVSTKFITKPEWAVGQSFEYDGTTSHSAVITKLDDAAYYDIVGNGNIAANEDGYTVTITLKSSHGDNIKWIGGTDEALSFTYYVTKAPTSIIITGFEQNSDNEYSIDLGKYDSERAYTIPEGTVALKDGEATASYKVKYIPYVGAEVEDFKGAIRDAGTYIITYTYAGNDNHNASLDATLTVTIGKADSSVSITPVTGDSIDATNKISVGYNDESHLPTVTINGVATNYSSASYTKPEGFVGSVTEIVGETAGTHTLTYVLTNDNNYADITVTVTIVIDQVENSDTITVASDARFDDKVLDKIILPENENGAWSLVIVGVTTNTSVDTNTVFGEVTTYTYKATFVSTNVNYADDYEEGTITVDKKLVTEPTVDDMEYTGELIKPTPEIKGPYTVTVNNGGKDRNTDSKAYYVEFTLDNPETHEWSKASDSINDIDGAKIKVYYDITHIVNKWKDDNELAIEGDKWIYSFGETIPVPTAMANEGTTYIQFRVKGTDAWIDWAHYDLEEGKWIPTGNAPEDNGTYEIRAIVYADNDKAVDEANNGKGNNYDRLVSVTKELVINKATVTIEGITVVGGTDFEYLTYNAWNTSILLNGISLKSTVTGVAVEGEVTVNVKYVPVIGNTIENFSGDVKNAGTYTIVYTFNGENTNYETETETIVITIQQSAASINGANDEREYSHKYDSDVYAVPGITPSHSEGTLVPTVTKDGVPAEMRNVGTYKVTYTLAATNNYYAATPVEVTVTITPATATITEADKEFRYNGTAYDTNDKLHALIGASASGIFAGDTANLIYTVSDNKIIENHGTYTVTIVLDDSNYGVWNAETETYDKVTETVTVTVLKKSVSIEGIANGAEITTDKSGNTLVYRGTEGYKLSEIIGAYFVDVNGDKIYTSTVYSQATLVNANEDGYTVTISLDNSNYEAASITVKVVIEKAEAAISFGSEVVNSTVTKPYVAGTSYDLATYIGASAIHNGQLVSGENNVNIKYYDENGNEITSLFEANENGYIVTVKLVAENYKAEETVTFIIKKANSSISGVTNGQEINVGYVEGKNHLPENVTINGKSVTPSITYTKPEGFDRDVTNYKEGETAGTYTLVYSFEGDSNYNSLTATVTLIINQVKNEDDVKWESTAEYGDNILGKFTLPENENGAWSVVGVDENTTFTTMGKNTFKAIFTSTNVNYADRVIEGIEITVGKKFVSIAGINDGATVTTDKSNGNKTLVYRGETGYDLADVIGAYFVDVNGNKIYTSTVYSQTTLVDANENGYTVTIALVHDNYDATSITVKVVIERMALVVPEVTGTYIYTVVNGVEKVHNLTYTSAYDVFKDLMLADGESLVSISGDKNSQAGDYSVEFTLNDTNNYKWVKAEGSNVTVNDDIATAPYNIGKAIPVITIGGVTVGDNNKHDLGSREYGAEGYAALPEVKVNGDVGNLSGTVTSAGSYTFTYKSAESANYSYREVTVTLVITKATADHVSITADWTNAGGEFGSEIKYPKVTVKVNDLTLGTGKYKVYYATSNVEDADWSEDKPTKAGIYYVKVVVAEDATNYFGKEVIFAGESFEITQKPTEIKITGTGIEGSNGTYTYNFGSYTGGTYTVPTGTVALANNGSTTVVHSKVSYTPYVGDPVEDFKGAIQAAGTYVITYTYSDSESNHADSTATLTVTIGQASLRYEDVIARYYGTEGWAAIAEKITVSGVNGETYEAEKITNVTIDKAGECEVTYQYGDNNYNVITTVVTYDIKKATDGQISITATDWTGGEFSSEIKYPTVTVKVNALDLDKDKYTVYYATSNAEDADWSEDKPTSAGTYYVKVVVAEDATNYFGAEMIFEDNSFEITQKPTEITIAGVTGSNGIYTYDFGKYTGGTYTVPTGTVALANDGSTTVVHSKVSYTPYVGDPVEGFKGAIQAAGIYVITYTYSDSENNHADSTATLTVTIGQASLSYSGENTIERYYGTEGWTAIAEKITVNGVVNGETYEATKNTDVTITEAGDYEVTYQCGGNNNYGGFSVVVTYAIKKATDGQISITATDWTGGEFGSEIKYPTVTVMVNALTLKDKYTVYYSTSKTEGWDTALPVNAGIYYVKVVVAEDATNYFGATKIFDESFEVTPASTSITASGVNETYGFTYETLEDLIGASCTGINNVDLTSKLVYSIVETDKLVNGKIVNVGIYTVKIVLNDSNYGVKNADNGYDLIETTVTVTVAQKETSFELQSGKENAVNNLDVTEDKTAATTTYVATATQSYGNITDADIFQHAGLGVKVSITSMTYNGTALPEDKWAIGDAGTYVITYIYDGSSGNYASAKLILTLTVEQASVAKPEVSTEGLTSNNGKYEVDYSGSSFTPSITHEQSNWNSYYTVTITCNHNHEEGEECDYKSVGTYTVSFELKSATNSAWNGKAPESFEYEIVPMTDNAIGEFNNKEFTYGDAISYNEAEAKAGKVVYEYAVGTLNDDGTYTYGDWIKWTEENYPEDAGSYKVRAIVVGTDNYNGCHKDAIYTIKPMSLTLDGELEDGYSEDYRGDLYNKTAEDLKEGLKLLNGEDKVELDINVVIYKVVYVDTKETYSKVDSITDAGTYKIIYSIDNNNYSMSDVTVTIIIKPLEVTIMAPIHMGSHYEDTFDFLGDPNAQPKAFANNEEIIGGTFECTGFTFNSDNPSESYYTLSYTVPNGNYKQPTSGVPVKVALIAVATLESGKNLTNYGSIAKALADANSGDKVWVIPDKAGNTVIRTTEENQTVTIKSGVTLILPYGKYIGTNDNASIRNQKIEATLTGGGLPNEATNLRTLVILGEGVTLEVYGTLEIAGELSGGNGGVDYSGQTKGNYAELRLDANSRVIIPSGASSAAIKAYGFITACAPDNGSRVIIENGILYQPFTLLDHMGGTVLSTMKDKLDSDYIAAFYEYQFRNVQTDVTIHSGGKLIVWANMDASLLGSLRHNATEVYMVGSGAYNSKTPLLQLKDGSYLNSKFDKDTGVMDLDIFGGATLNSMVMTLSIPIMGNVTLSTANVYFPLSWTMNVSLNPTEEQLSINEIAEYNVAGRLQVMWGSEFVIEKGAKLTVNKDMVVHNNYATNQNVGIQIYADSSPNQTKALSDAIFIVRGELVVSGGLGGNIISDTPGAKVKATSVSATWKKVTDSSVNLTNVVYNIGLYKNQNGSYVKSNTSPSNGVIAWYNGTDWVSASVDADFNVNMEYVGIDQNGNETKIKKDVSSYDITELKTIFANTIISLPNDNLENYKFIGWYISRGDNGYTDEYRIITDIITLEELYTELLADGNNDVTIYCVMASPSYTFEYEDGTDSELDDSTVIYSVTQLPYAQLATLSQYDFDTTKSKYHIGWNLVDADGNVIATFTRTSANAWDVSDLEDIATAYLSRIECVDNDYRFSLVAIWADKTTVTVNYGENVLGLESKDIYLNFAFGQNRYDALADITVGNADYAKSLYSNGWSAPAGVTVSGTTVTITSANNVEIEVIWIAKTVLTIYYGDNSMGYESITTVYLNTSIGQKTYDAKVTSSISDYSKETYFNGWESMSGCTVDFTGNIITVASGVSEAYINAKKWLTKDSITIIYGENGLGLPEVKVEYIDPTTNICIIDNVSVNDSNTYVSKYFGGWKDFTLVDGSYVATTASGATVTITGTEVVLTNLSAETTDNITIEAIWADKISLSLKGDNGIGVLSDGTDLSININTSGYVRTDDSFATDVIALFNQLAKSSATVYDYNVFASKYFYGFEYNGKTYSDLGDNAYETIEYSSSSDTINIVWKNKVKIEVTNNHSTSLSSTTAQFKYTIHFYDANGNAYKNASGGDLTYSYGPMFDDYEQSYYVISGHQIKFSNCAAGTVPSDIPKTMTPCTKDQKFQFKTSEKISCVTPDTLVTLADGTQKRIDQVVSSDILKVWNFYDGEYAYVPAALIQYHGYGDNIIIKLTFSDGTVTRAINEHAYFDATINEFVFVRAKNAHSLIGHKFVKEDGDSYTTVTLVDVEVTTEYIESYSILSAYYYNFITDRMFSLTSPVIETNFFMQFVVGENMQFDEEKMAEDIDKYGLYEYSDFEGKIPYEVFEGLNIKYLKVAVGKNLITYDQIIELLKSEGVVE